MNVSINLDDLFNNYMDDIFGMPGDVICKILQKEENAE